MADEIEYSKMNLKDLTDRSNMIAKKYSAAYRSGASQEILNQIQEHLDMIKTAIWEHQYTENFKATLEQESMEDTTHDDSIV